MYNLIDIGANLGHPLFKDDLNDVIERSKCAGVSKIMVTGTSVQSSIQARGLALQFPKYLYFTAGVHPHDAKEFGTETISELRKLFDEPECVAVGECGLDYNRNFSPPEQQRIAFDEQLRLACELKKPLFIHERDAHGDMVSFLSKHKGQLPLTVMHCFTGTADEASEYVKMGCYIGLTGFLWKDRSEFGVKHGLSTGKIPLERLVLETDAPFMYAKINDKKLPSEIRERITEKARSLHKYASFNRNEPCALAAICELIAAYLNEDPVKVADITSKNAKYVYGLL